MIDFSKSILQALNSEELTRRNIRMSVKRDDLLHEEISGNKWRKLKFNVQQCLQYKNEGVLTFGGAYSNHLVATAAACSTVGIKSIGIVRGDELNQDSNETLKRCANYGMQLIFVSREMYQLRNDRYYQEALLIEHSNYLIVPEGGANYLGMIGCQEIINQIDDSFDVIVAAQGTTTTSCGLALGLNEDQKLMVVPALKGFDVKGEMERLLIRSAIAEETIDQVNESLLIRDEFHFGGYGKYTSELLNFIRDFYLEFNIKLDPVYTGKAMFALMEEIGSGNLDGQNIIFLHTGGIQGARSIEDKSGFELYPAKP